MFNFPGAPRTDPVSWAFPAEDAHRAMALAGSVGAIAGSTDGGSSWTPMPHIRVPEALSVAVGGSDRQTRMAVTGNGVPNDWTNAVEQGPFKTSSHLLVHADQASRTFSASVDAAPASQITWGKLPAPTVIFAPSSGGVIRFPDGMLLATVFVWIVPPVTADGHKAVMGKPWFPRFGPNPGLTPCACPAHGPPNNHTCSACPTWGQCCNNSVVAYISRDNGSSFEYRGVVADKASVNTLAGYSGEGPNENAVALLGDNRTVICIMRRDSAVSARAHADVQDLTIVTAVARRECKAGTVIGLSTPRHQSRPTPSRSRQIEVAAGSSRSRPPSCARVALEP